MRKSRVNIKTENLLRQHGALRDSDPLLLLAYWATEGLHLTKEQRDKFVGCTPAESITRARRSLRGKYPGSKKVEQARFYKMQQTREQYSPDAGLRYLEQRGLTLVDD